MKITFDQAKELTAEILAVSPPAVPMIKLPLDNIVFGKLEEIPMLEMLVNLHVVTKEHPEGALYDKTRCQMVVRIIDGVLLMRGKDLEERPDAYAWHVSKVEKAKNKKKIGFHSTEGAMTYAELLPTIKNDHEKGLFTDLLLKWHTDLLLVHTEAESRDVILVTEELIQRGITEVPNSYDIEWPAKGSDGVELTPIKVGDALVIEKCSFGDAFYVVQKEEFEITHKLA